MVDILKYSVGIDVSSEDLVVRFGELSLVELNLVSQVSNAKKFTNKTKGFKSLNAWIKKQCGSNQAKIIVVMEATGVYHEKAAHYLHEKGYEIKVVLPNKAKRYLQSLGYRSKNDPIDSRGLTQMGLEQQQLEKWTPPSPIMSQLKALTRHRQRLQQRITAVNNQLHAVENSFHCSKQIKKQLKSTITFHKKQIKQLESEIEQTLKMQPELEAKLNRIVQSIKGIGRLTMVTLIAETNDFQMFFSQQQIVKYAGYDVIENQSGKFKGKERISKKGNARIRRCLHMPALNMVTFGTGTFPKTYDKIYQKSGIKMKGYVAIQRKLLCLLFTLWKKDRVFNPEHVNELCSAAA